MTRVAIDPGITNKKHTPVLSGLGVLLYRFVYLDIPYSLDILPLSVGYRKRRKKSIASMRFCRSAERSGSDIALLMGKAKPLPMVSREAQKGPFRKRRKRRKKYFCFLKRRRAQKERCW